MRVAVLAPIQSSLYSRLVIHQLAQVPEIELVGALVRTPWTWGRIRSELRRDGARLLRKAYRKLVLRERDFNPDAREHLLGLAQETQLPGKTVADVCQSHQISCVTVSDHNAPAALEFLRSRQPDVIAFTGGGLIRRELLAIPSQGVVNCHMGPLPRYRGMDVVEYPVLENRLADEGTGLTLHFMDAGVDTGPLLLNERILPRASETFAVLRHRLERHMVELMVRGIAELARGTLQPRPQRVDEGRQYYVLHPRLHQLAVETLRLHSKVA